MKQLKELIKERDAEIELAHYSLSSSKRREHREKVNQLNEQIRATIQGAAKC